MVIIENVWVLAADTYHIANASKTSLRANIATSIGQIGRAGACCVACAVV